MADEKVYTFEVGDKKYRVESPTVKQLNAADKVHLSAFNDAVKDGAMIRKKLEQVWEQQGIWNDKIKNQYEELRAELLADERRLQGGGIKLKEAKEIALNMRKLRDKLADMSSGRQELDSMCAEGKADNMKFNFLISECIVEHDTGKRVYKSLDDYLTNASGELATKAAQQFFSLMYGTDASTAEASLPENKFLRRFKFVDEKLRLTDEEGRLVDEEGRLIDEEGYFIDEEGNRVDIDGHPVDEDGKYKIEYSPFLDDDGNPVDESQFE